HRDSVEQTLAVLDHVDVAHLTPWISCPTRVTVGLADLVCPPSGIFTAINAMTPPPDVTVWPHNGHEGGGAHDEAGLAAWLDHHHRGERWPPRPAPATPRRGSSAASTT